MDDNTLPQQDASAQDQSGQSDQQGQLGGQDQATNTNSPNAAEQPSLPTEPPIEPGEAVAETLAHQEVDPAEVVGGDEKIMEHINQAEQNAV